METPLAFRRVLAGFFSPTSTAIDVPVRRVGPGYLNHFHTPPCHEHVPCRVWE